MKKFLNEKGIAAITAYANIKQSNIKSREAFMVIADSLQVDALVAFSVNGTLEDGTDKLAYTFAKSTVKAMIKDGMFVTKK
ncbi:MAG: hypothetical protein WCO02_00185 [Bacteroidota bacterium]